METFDAYLEGRMTSEEVKKFEDKLKNDVELKNQFDKHKQTVSAVKQHGRNHLKAHLEDLHKDLGQQPAVKGSGFRKKWLVGSLVLLVAALAYYLLQSQEKEVLDNREVFQMAYEDFPSPSMRSAEAMEDASSWDLYRKKDYTQFLLDTRKLESIDLRVQLMRGCAYLNVDSIEQALEVFNSVGELENQIYSSTGWWYAGLAALKNGNQELAKKYFGNISKESSYSDKANNIMSSMN